MKKFLKSLNWHAFIAVLCIGILGGLSNNNIENTLHAFLFGVVIGSITGLIFAIVTRK